MTKISAVVPDEIAGALEQRAQAEDRSMSAEVRRALSEYLASPSVLGSRGPAEPRTRLSDTGAGGSHSGSDGGAVEARARWGTSSAVQIDHVVALAAAWRTGAQQWTGDVRVVYANDRSVLLAVDGPTNGSKGDRDAASWLPPNVAYHCRYVAKQIAIKTKYELWVTLPERMKMTAVLGSC